MTSTEARTQLNVARFILKLGLKAEHPKAYIRMALKALGGPVDLERIL